MEIIAAGIVKAAAKPSHLALAPVDASTHRRSQRRSTIGTFRLQCRGNRSCHHTTYPKQKANAGPPASEHPYALDAYSSLATASMSFTLRAVSAAPSSLTTRSCLLGSQHSDTLTACAIHQPCIGGSLNVRPSCPSCRSPLGRHQFCALGDHSRRPASLDTPVPRGCTVAVYQPVRTLPTFTALMSS